MGWLAGETRDINQLLLRSASYALVVEMAQKKATGLCYNDDDDNDDAATLDKLCSPSAQNTGRSGIVGECGVEQQQQQ